MKGLRMSLSAEEENLLPLLLKLIEDDTRMPAPKVEKSDSFGIKYRFSRPPDIRPEPSSSSDGLFIKLAGPTSPGDKPFDFRRYPFAELFEALYTALETLLPRQREILLCRYTQQGKEKWTLQALADHYGVSRQRVHEIEQDALRKLRKTIILILTKRDG